MAICTKRRFAPLCKFHKQRIHIVISIKWELNELYAYLYSMKEWQLILKFADENNLVLKAVGTRANNIVVYISEQQFWMK